MSQVTLPGWSQAMLGAYYYATLPCRRRYLAQSMACGQAPVAILFYHRVADRSPNGWTISRRQFFRQVRWLQRHFEMLSLREVQHRLESGTNRNPAVCITFDDGYAENCEYALPLLLGARIPFTYFVTTQHVTQQTAFPHDVKAGIPLQPNTWEQLRALAAAGVEIGAHTRTHVDLGQVADAQVMRDEVAGSRADLQDRLDCSVDYFAFPYGLHENLNADVFALARQEGFRGLCSAYGGYNFPGDDAFHLQRIHADPEMVRFKNWLTFDPRKLRSVKRYEVPVPTEFLNEAGS